MNAPELSSSTLMPPERRQSARQVEHEQFVITEAVAEDPRHWKAWSFNSSEQGICFRCRDVLPERVLVDREEEGVLALQILRRENLRCDVWEYAARIMSDSESSEFHEAVLNDIDSAQLSVTHIVREMSEETRDAIDDMRQLAVSATNRTMREHRRAKLNQTMFRLTGFALFAVIGGGLAAAGVVPKLLQVPLLAVAGITLLELGERWRLAEQHT